MDVEVLKEFIRYRLTPAGRFNLMSAITYYYYEQLVLFDYYDVVYVDHDWTAAAAAAVAVCSSIDTNHKLFKLCPSENLVYSHFYTYSPLKRNK